MRYQYPTLPATIQKRYKRFLSDITLDSGEEVVAHVPNTGSMTTCWDKDWRVLVSHVDNPTRKLKYTLELTHNGKCWISVNTSTTNKIVHEALEQGKITQLQNYQDIRPEKKIYDSRIDFFLSGHADLPDAYVEVKNVTLKGEGDTALFPDAVSTRGQKHLLDLMKIKKTGLRAVMLYLINRSDVNSFSPAYEIDPEYAKLVHRAKEAGVEILCYQTHIDENEIYVEKEIKAIYQ